VDAAILIGLATFIVLLVGLLLGPVRSWVADRRNRPVLSIRTGEMGYLADVSAERLHRVRLEVSNERGRAAADEVQVVVVDTEMPPRVAVTLPKTVSSIERVGLPLRWADSFPPTSTTTIPPGATRAVELLFIEAPSGDGRGPSVVLDIIPATVRIELDCGMGNTGGDVTEVAPGLRGLEHVPAKVRLGLRSRQTSEQPYTFAINYSGFWPFGQVTPDHMGTHVRTKLLDGHIAGSESPWRQPPHPPPPPADIYEGEWADLGLPPQSELDRRMKMRELARSTDPAHKNGGS
jgi:hypothetical protein